MVVFRGWGREMPISGCKWWKCYQFGIVIACPNAMAAPGTILHPETQKTSVLAVLVYFCDFHQNDGTLGVSGVIVGSFAAIALGQAITMRN